MLSNRSDQEQSEDEHEDERYKHEHFTALLLLLLSATCFRVSLSRTLPCSLHRSGEKEDGENGENEIKKGRQG